jgi:hypothetical protein
LSYQKVIYKTSSRVFQPRTTETSKRAGQIPELKPIRRSISASGALATVEREKKIKEVERQLEAKADLFKDKMAKSMISPSARDAPRFSSNRPQELRRFVRIMEDLWEQAEITDDEVKKVTLGKYADQESEEEWKAFATYPKGHSYKEFKAELMDNYPEAAEAERGTPARIKQVCRERKGIKLGDLGALYAFRRAFMAEARKLTTTPPAMSNREMVELFIGTLSQPFAQAVIQFLGNKMEAIHQAALAAGVSKTPRRPEDRYDLEEVCKAAIQVSDNSQGMFYLMKSGVEKAEGRRESNFNQYASETSDLVQKLEGLENSQAEEKDKLEISNKNLNNRFNDLEKMMKSMMNQNINGNGNRREPVEQYSPNNGVKLGQPGTIPRWGPPSNGRGGNFVDNGCYYCGHKGHFIPDCDELKNDLRTGYVTQNSDGKLRNGEGGFISNIPVGAPIKEKVEKQKIIKQSQFYCDSGENDYLVEVPMYPAQFMNSSEDPAHRHARLEKELKQKEDELELRRFRLEKEEKNKEQKKGSETAQLLEKVLEQISTKEEALKAGFC